MDVAYLQVSHGCIAYQWSHGQVDNPLVVLHGLGDSAIHTYAPRFERTVLKNTPALFVDFPGFGEGKADAPYSANIENMAGDVATLLQKLQIPAGTAFAHSMGANVAMVLAHRHPGVFSRMILAEPLIHREQSVLAAGIAKYTEDAFLARGYHMLIRATSLQAQRGETAAIAFLPVLKQANPLTLYRSAKSLLAHREPDFLSMLSHEQQRIHLLIGGNSGVPPANIRHLEIATSVIPNAAHFMMVEQADATACAILNLVN